MGQCGRIVILQILQGQCGHSDPWDRMGIVGMTRGILVFGIEERTFKEKCRPQGIEPLTWSTKWTFPCFSRAWPIGPLVHLNISLAEKDSVLRTEVRHEARAEVRSSLACNITLIVAPGLPTLFVEWREVNLEKKIWSNPCTSDAQPSVHNTYSSKGTKVSTCKPFIVHFPKPPRVIEYTFRNCPFILYGLQPPIHTLTQHLSKWCLGSSKYGLSLDIFRSLKIKLTMLKKDSVKFTSIRPWDEGHDFADHQSNAQSILIGVQRFECQNCDGGGKHHIIYADFPDYLL
ncbi:hypothetical protein VNO77_08679 [Canavalia gladiata]|uniref:Uncharacterized protein n=1 Tax=Canavalia gladiata TaxID=3824 RepID=A0AAN9MA80_CANGL